MEKKGFALWRGRDKEIVEGKEKRRRRREVVGGGRRKEGERERRLCFLPSSSFFLRPFVQKATCFSDLWGVGGREGREKANGDGLFCNATTTAVQKRR